MTRETQVPNQSRRRLLATLGLGATAAYMTPTLLSLDQARASGASAGSGRSGRRARRNGRRRGSRS